MASPLSISSTLLLEVTNEHSREGCLKSTWGKDGSGLTSPPQNDVTWSLLSCRQDPHFSDFLSCPVFKGVVLKCCMSGFFVWLKILDLRQSCKDNNVLKSTFMLAF